jgi:hypothetical protein
VEGEPVRKVVISGLIWLRAALRLLARGLRLLLQILLALLIVLEEWGWRPLADALARLARWRPIAALERFVAGLPPYPALVAFVLPSTLLLPLKFIALILVGRGYYLASVALFLVAKGVATALVARLFMLTQPALMRIPWFAWGYNILIPWKDALTERVRNSLVWRTGRALKWRAKRALAPFWLGLKPRIVAMATEVRGFLSKLVGRRRDPRG